MADIRRYDDLGLDSTLRFADECAENGEFDVAIDVLRETEKKNPSNLFVKDRLARCYLTVGAYIESIGVLGDIVRRASYPGENALMRLQILLEMTGSEAEDLYEIYGLQRPSPGYEDDEDDEEEEGSEGPENALSAYRTRDIMKDAIDRGDYDKAVKTALEFASDSLGNAPVRDEISELALRAAYLAGDRELAMAFAVSVYKRTGSFTAADILLRISSDFGNDSLFNAYFETFFNDFTADKGDLRNAVELVKCAYSLGRYDSARAAAEACYASSKYIYDLNVILAALYAVSGDHTAAEHILDHSAKVLPRCPFFVYFKEVFSETRHLPERRDRYIATRLVADDIWGRFTSDPSGDDRNTENMAHPLRLRLRREAVLRSLKNPYLSRPAVKINKTLLGALIAPLT